MVQSYEYLLLGFLVCSDFFKPRTWTLFKAHGYRGATSGDVVLPHSRRLTRLAVSRLGVAVLSIQSARRTRR